jgi:predicted phosphodiesterase
MILSEFLDRMAARSGADALRGAMVFVALQRPLDDLIRTGLGLGPFHPGQPSLWSHCFLIADQYAGTQTPILDCTIRDSHGAIIWDASLEESLEILFKGVADTAGGIYDGVVADYDHPRVTIRGLKLLPGLTNDQRTSLVAAGHALQAQGYHYDLPGLFRELVRLLTHIALPAGDRLLFCSAFLQTVYRNALGRDGNFAPGTLSVDVTPDEIWYASLGAKFIDTALPTVPTLTPVGAVPTATPSVAGPTATTAVTPIAPTTSAASAHSASLIEDIGRAIAAVTERSNLPDRDKLLVALKKAQEQALKAHQQAPFYRSDALLSHDDYYLSLVQSARHSAAVTPATAGVRAPLRGMEIIGLNQYEDLDPGWIASLWHRLWDTKVPFPTHEQRHIDPVMVIGDQVKIAMAGDWGTGETSSDLIAAYMRATTPEYTIHLGDVYYSGTESEESRFVDRWPAGTNGAFALNSNHEMYSGGAGYFNIALRNTKFAAQQGLSYFALHNAKWVIVGLDTAYFSTDFTYQNGNLDEMQLQWLTTVCRQAREAGKRIILLTHHHGMDLHLAQTHLWSQVVRALNGGPDFWYWGHVHAGAAFNPVVPGSVQIHPRCIGHGGVPYQPLDQDVLSGLAWGESELAGDAQEERRALNGYVVLMLDGSGLVEEFYDERGRLRWSMRHP